MSKLADALFNPRRIALIGASSDAKRLTARAQVHLRRHGFTGELFPVNPRAPEVLGERAYASLAEVPGPVDLAYVLVNTAQVEGAIEACAAARVPVACLLADGFAEAGPERVALQERVLAAARVGGVRVLGPNSMGVINVPAATACSVNAALEAEALLPGRWSLLSHSGSVMGTLSSRAAGRGFGFAKVVGTGNEADLSAGELISLLVDDPETDAILLFLETIRRPELCEEAARRAHAAGKPIVAYKLDRPGAIGRLPAAAGRCLAQAAGRRRLRGLPHAGGLRRCGARLSGMAGAARAGRRGGAGGRAPAAGCRGCPARRPGGVRRAGHRGSRGGGRS